MRITLARTMTVVGAIMCLGVVVAYAAQTPAPQAHEKVELFKQELSAAAASQQAGDEAGAGKHQAAAQAALTEARALYDAKKKSIGKDRAALLEYAEVLNAGGDFDLAADALKRVTRLEPDNGEAWTGIAIALAQCGPSRARDAEAAARKAIALMKAPADSAKAYAALGDLYRREGLYDLARENFDLALRADDKSVSARIGLAALNVRDGRPRDAEALLGALGQISDASARQLDSTLKDALDDFQHTRRFIPDAAADHLAYAKLLVRAGRMRESVGPLERSVKLDPKDPVAWNLLGSISHYLNDTKRAREAFTQSLALKPDDVKTQAELKELDSAPAPQAPAPTAASGGQ